jgi:hypothetical protein
MDASKFKELFQRFGFFREYSALVVPLVLTIVAGLLFVPTILMQSRLKAEIQDKSIRKLGDPIDRLSKTTPVPLKQSEEEKKYQDDFAQDANNIISLAEQTSRRQLLSYNILPDTTESSVQIYTHFGENFRQGINKMIADLKARDCPTPIELSQHTGTAPVATSTTTAVSGQTEDQRQQLIQDGLCYTIAKSILVYINPDNINGYAFWKNYQYQNKKDAIEDCWYWQLGYWIIEDIFQTVKKANYNSSSVLDSPVKRIVSISFQASQTAGTGQNLPTSYSRARPKYVTDIKGGLIVPFTGRICDDQTDVVHFKVSVVVSAKAAGRFIQELCSGKEHIFKGFDGNAQPLTYRHNQITVLDASLEAVSEQQPVHKLYRYGNDGVVILNLTCEYIFNSKGYDKIKPKSVKDELKRIIKK